MKKLKQLYASLIENLAKKGENYFEDELTIFSASAGTDYNGKIMIVGRAVNGWNHYLDPRSERSVQECICSIQNALGVESLDWVKTQWGSKEKYNTKKSAFWRLSKAISAIANPSVEFHTDSIVWTNLYKAAKESGGNPSERLMNVQFDHCKKILDEEISFYRPEVIIFLTGLNWAKDFLTNATRREINGDLEYVELVGTYQKCKYIVGQHPQGKNEAIHLKEITGHLN